MIVLKIILFILLAILGIILLALLMPVRVQFSFIGEKVVYRLKYGFINIMDSDGKGLVSGNKKEKSKSGKKKNKTRDKQETAQTEKKAILEEEKNTEAEDNTEKVKKAPDTVADEKTSVGDETEASENTEEKTKKTLGEKVDFILGIWRSAKRPLRRLLKGFHFSDIYIDFLTADEDAYKCAVKYGRICGIVYNGLAQMSLLFTVKIKSVDINAGFAQDKSRWDAGVKIWFIPMTAVIAGVWFLVTYIFRIYLPQKRMAKKSAKINNTQPQGGM